MTQRLITQKNARGALVLTGDPTGSFLPCSENHQRDEQRPTFPRYASEHNTQDTKRKYVYVVSFETYEGKRKLYKISLLN